MDRMAGGFVSVVARDTPTVPTTCSINPDRPQVNGALVTIPHVLEFLVMRAPMETSDSEVTSHTMYTLSDWFGVVCPIQSSIEQQCSGIQSAHYRLQTWLHRYT